MNNQEIFNLLSELECMTYYHNDRTPSEEAEQINKKAREVLEAFAGLTGCHN